ncbi:MAG TPA: transposase [Gemmataceae bacterium]|jgi:transposase|nr:transposase [Gemmataceae bacterium]
MTESTHYGDLTDAEWSLIEPLLPLAAGSPPGQELRLVINGILFLIRSGSPVRTAPPWSTVECYYGQWQADGTWHRITAALQGTRPGAALPGPHLTQGKAT